ncbi:hypothetical protein FOZ63_014962, partial [Perkinsus olseni]
YIGLAPVIARKYGTPVAEEKDCLFASMPNFYEEPVAGGMSEKLWKYNQYLARKSLHHPFVQGLGDGTLDPEAFKHYVAQDSFFLNGYIRALCYCIAKSDVTATEKDLLLLLDGVRREAEALHHNYIDSPEVG